MKNISWAVVSAWPPFAFFFSRGKFRPPYFWITVFCSLAAWMFVRRIRGDILLSDGLIIGVLGFVLGWIIVYTWYDYKTKGGPAPGLSGSIAIAEKREGPGEIPPAQGVPQ